jgi:hypothetical protein
MSVRRMKEENQSERIYVAHVLADFSGKQSPQKALRLLKLIDSFVVAVLADYTRYLSIWG